MSEQAVTLTVDSNGVAFLTLNVPGQAVNTLSDAFTASFAKAFEEVERRQDIRAAVLISSKSDNFIAGADVNMLEKVKTAQDGETLSRQGQEAFQRLSDCQKPFVAAIHGGCLGGGLELALACHARIATDHDKTKLGLPEVQLGLIPGAGGTQRLPRLIGLQAALDLILTGKQVPARKAKKLGLVDDVVPVSMLRQAATDAALTLVDKTEPKGLERIASSLRHVFSAKELQEIMVEDNPLGRKVLFDTAKKQLLKKTKGNYPAPEKALEAIRIGAGDAKAGYAAEARFFGELLVSPEAKELMNIFFATTAMKKDLGIDDAGVEPRTVEKIGIMGAGLMGAGIAYVSTAVAGVSVRIKDRDAQSLGRGLAYVREIVDERVAKRRMTPRERIELMSMISPTTDYTGLHDARVVIEAVFEDLELKKQVVRDVEAAGPSDVIFASNTSTIPITRIAEASAHPETVIGMHYFSPVHKMPLLEIIVTDKTAPWVTATCVKLGKRQGKTVIVVRDGVGFYTSRILGPYMNEAFHLLAEGVSIEAIDGALVQFGFPVGPVKLLDEVGIDVAQKASAVVREAFGDRLDAPPGMEALITDNRLGRKNKRGMYLYDGKKKGVDPSVYRLLGITPSKELSADEIARRCVLQMVNEAAYCFGEGILRSARDGDIGAIFGLGFPPFRGGPFRYADQLGIDSVVAALRGYESAVGKRFAPAPVLTHMAGEGLRFYAEPGRDKTIAPGTHRR